MNEIPDAIVPVHYLDIEGRRLCSIPRRELRKTRFAYAFELDGDADYGLRCNDCEIARRRVGVPRLLAALIRPRLERGEGGGQRGRRRKSSRTWEGFLVRRDGELG